MSRRVTLKDVAAQVGVSYQTVSKVLNGQATVAPETAVLIRQYDEAMRNAGLPIDPAWLRRGEGEVPVGYALTTDLLQLPTAVRPTAVAAVDDHLAIGAMQAVQAAGLAVGAEVGITGFDDTAGIQHLSPPLTSVRQPIWQVGQEIVQLLIGLIQGAPPQRAQLHLSPRLIVRQSSLRT